MLVRVLQRLDPFRQLRLPELQTIARHAQILNLPAKRWLLRSDRKLSGAYYLLRGRLKLWSPARTLAAQDAAASSAFYPGCRAAQASSAIQVLHIDTAPIAFLWEVVTNGGLQTPVPDDAWLNRFLSSPLLQRLDPARWQQLLRGAAQLSAQAGDVIVRAGELGHSFYVMKRGRALVERGGKCVALLGPGDFFGEDALVTGQPRNATVTMQAPGELLLLSKERFLQILVAYIVGDQCLAPSQEGKVKVLWVAGPAPMDPSYLHLPLRWFRESLVGLELRAHYQVAGGSLPERALALLLLAQHGLQASYAREPVENAAKLGMALLPAKQAPSAPVPSYGVG